MCVKCKIPSILTTVCILRIKADPEIPVAENTGRRAFPRIMVDIRERTDSVVDGKQQPRSRWNRIVCQVKLDLNTVHISRSFFPFAANPSLVVFRVW